MNSDAISAAALSFTRNVHWISKHSAYHPEKEMFFLHREISVPWIQNPNKDTGPAKLLATLWAHRWYL